jgi:hypothetical protein
MTPVAQAAEEYARRGWTVIPANGKKKPRVRWKRYQTETPSPSVRARWFSKPVPVLLLILKNGVCVRDWDTDDGYPNWAAAHPDLAAKLPTVKTRRGFHVYFRNHDARYQKLPDGELQASAKHYVVVPPSTTDGFTRFWTVPLGDELPTVDPEAVGLVSYQAITVSSHRRIVTSSHRCINTSSHRHIDPVGRKEEGLKMENNDIESVIEATQPSGIGQRRACVWSLVKRLRALPDLATADGQSLLPVARAWWERALPVVRTKDWSETAEDFLEALANYDPAKEGLASAFAEAVMRPPVAAVADLDNPRLGLLANACAVLQARAGDMPFFLAQAPVAAYFGVPSETAGRWLRVLVGLGLLERVAVGGRPAGGKARASTYWWRGVPAGK